MTAGLRELVARPTLDVARALLGTRLVREDEAGRRIGRIVELEAYLGPADQASHARSGETPRSRPLFGEPGSAYVYLVYGMYRCLNIVTGPPGVPHAILVRAVQPLEGIDLVRAARCRAEARAHRSFGPADIERVRARLERTPDDRLASGPGLVGAGFDVGLDLTGVDLLDPSATLHLEAASPGEPEPAVLASRRIGIGYAGLPWTEQPWRFSIAGHPSVSA